MTKEQFIEKFVAHMAKLAGPTFLDDGSSVEEYARQTAPSYWEDEWQRADGPEYCAESDISYWEE